MRITIDVNGESRSTDVHGAESLLDVLRDQIALPGSKSACEQGECGSCSVVLDGELVCSCLVMAADADQSVVTTIEGVGDGEALHAVQRAMLDAGGVQCGFCTPGFVVAAAHLFDHNPTPQDDEIVEALAGNVCRCTGYGSILRGLREIADANREAPSA